MPGTRPLAKKRTGVEAVHADFPELLGQTPGADVFDERGVVREHVVGGVGTFAHVPAKTEVLFLDPAVRDSLEGASVLGGGGLAGCRRIW